MAGATRVEWLGNWVEAKVVAATKAAIDETTNAAAEDAKEHHWYANRTGSLEKNTFAAPAVIEGPRIVGKFGSSMRREGFYGLFLERRTPWLRPAADRHFHELPVRIRAGLKWM